MDILFDILAGNKFDTAEKLWPFLLSGLVVLPLVIIFWKKMTQKISWFEIIALLGFLALSWLSFIFSQAKTFGFSEMYVLTAAVALYLVFAQIKKNYSILLGIIVALAFLASIFGLLYFVSEFEPRIAGIFFYPLKRAAFFPNAFALFLLMAWPLAWHFSMEQKNWKFDLMTGVILGTLILTYSRGAWLTLLAQLFILLFFVLRHHTIRKGIFKRSAFIGIFTLLTLFLAFAARGSAFPTKSLTERALIPPLERRTSVSERFEFFEGAAELSIEKPLLGWGPFSFGKVYRSRQQNLLGISDHPHNWLLKVAAENGIITLLFLAGFLGYVIFSSRKMHEEKSNPLSSALFLCVAGGIIHNLVDYNFNFLLNIFLFWMILGIMRSRMSEPETHKSHPGKFFALALALALFILGIREASLAYQNNQEDSYFPRYYFIGSARDAVQKNDFDEAWHMLAHQAQKSPLDAEIENLRGNTAYRKRKFEDALGYYRKALELDPKNMFVYHRNVLEMTILLKQRDEKFENELLELIDEYIPLLEQNAHFTAFTDNPHQVGEILKLLGQKQRGLEVQQLAETVKQREIQEKKLEWELPFQ